MLQTLLIVILGLISVPITVRLIALALAHRLPNQHPVSREIVLGDVLQWVAITTLYGAALFYSLPSKSASLILVSTVGVGAVMALALMAWSRGRSA